MTFCYAPWSNIDIDSQGEITPCCKFNNSAYPDTANNIKTHALVDYRHSNTLAQVKKDFLEDKWPVGCDRCRIEEENNIKSKRQLDYQRWQQHYTDYDLEQAKILTASIAFGNTCNLTCITCGPMASSRWQSEYKKIYNIDVPPNHFYKQGFVNDFLTNAPDLVHIDIPGGEPFLSGVPLQHQILQRYIDSGQSQTVSLHYTTNATVFPGPEWWHLWSHFREVDLQLSIDGVGDQYEYIRFPAVWKNTVENVKQYVEHAQRISNIKLSVSKTVSAFNIAYLPEFFKWCSDIGLPKPWLGRVHLPQHFRASVWSGEAKQYIISKLSKSPYLDTRTWARLLANVDDSQHFAEFVQRTQQHDQYRNTSFADTFPEMAKYFS